MHTPPFPIPRFRGLRCFILILACLGVVVLRGSTVVNTEADSCGNPITIASISVQPSLCGLSGGSISVNLLGGNNGYSFQWDPSVSMTGSASLLAAGAYQLTITRNNEPACTLDTTIIVNNSNGPAVQVVDVQPSNCLAANGEVSLSPTSLFYVWDNGEIGAVNDGLLSICYYITATEPGTGCSTVFKVCVPNVNPLETGVEILQGDKCGKNTGAAQINVSGGSGEYAYSLGPSATLNGLPAGDYVCQIVDNATGCTDEAQFSIPEAVVQAQVNITPYNISCPGGGTGFVGFEVVPGPNFALPYTFSIRDTNNLQFQPGNLLPGKYYLQIVDADSCALPLDSFYITQPPPIVTTAQIIPETCEQGGQIQLSISGGNGGFRVDWLDLPGSNNTEDRINLPAGLYKAVVFDSLFCTDTLDTYLVPRFCSRNDTLPLFVPGGAIGLLCLEGPIGIPSANVDYQLIGGGFSGSSGYGSWTLSTAGCLSYAAGSTTGYAVDTICVAVNVSPPNLSDTICLIVSILTQPPSYETLYFTVQTDQTATSCGIIPPAFNNPVVLQLNRPGLSGTSDAFGKYNINPASACLSFQANALPGFNVDTILVAACDTQLMRSHTIRYIPTVLPPIDCSVGFVPEDNLSVETTDCDNGAWVCLPIPFGEIENFAVTDNDLPYLLGYLGCDLDTVVSYSVGLLSPGSPYQLNEWSINGQTFSGAFQDVNGLVALMNQLDPVPGWMFVNNFYIIGGNPANNYGPIRTTSSQAVVDLLQSSLQFIPRGSQLRFLPGDHELVLRRIQTGCADTVHISVQCIDCPPVHTYATDPSGQIFWETGNCLSDSVFCTVISEQDLDNWLITDNDAPVSGFQACGNGTVGIRLDTGYHFLYFFNTLSDCAYTVPLTLGCAAAPAVFDTVSVNLSTGQNASFCPDPALLPSPAVSIENNCNSNNGAATFNLDVSNNCAILNGIAQGQDTLCFQFCNGSGACYTLTVFISVSLPDTLAKPLLVFNGFSPNGDNTNDFWHIQGIEAYPDNTVQVFNRYGNLVFEQKSYSNADAWDGAWNGKALPDGTYYYLIELEKGGKRLSGYVELRR